MSLEAPHHAKPRDTIHGEIRLPASGLVYERLIVVSVFIVGSDQRSVVVNELDNIFPIVVMISNGEKDVDIERIWRKKDALESQQSYGAEATTCKTKIFDVTVSQVAANETPELIG